MNKVQKVALLDLILAAGGLGIAGLRMLIPADTSAPQILASTALVIICSFLVAAHALLVKVGRQGEKHYDERDKSINKNAFAVGCLTFFIVVVSACLISFFVGGPGGVMPIGRVLGILVIGGLACLFVWAVAILVQYSWADEGEKS